MAHPNNTNRPLRYITVSINDKQLRPDDPKDKQFQANVREDDQPMPKPNRLPDIQSQVVEDIERRRMLGIQRYGTVLQPHNGRDMLLDAYEEALDLAIYLKGVLVERDTPSP